MGLEEVHIGAVPPGLFRLVIEPDALEALLRTIKRAQAMLSGRVVWNVNSTGMGGGVAEMLRSLLAYSRGAGIDARWLVIPGSSEFFLVTKRIHNHLHAFPGDGGDLGRNEREVYERTLQPAARALASVVGPKDIVLLHDPQTAGLAPLLVAGGITVVWRCHVGTDEPSELTRRAWAFLGPYLANANAYVFSKRRFIWENLEPEKVVIIPPSIDPFSPKNTLLGHVETSAILNQAGLLANHSAGTAIYVRHDGSMGRVVRRATLTESAPAPADARLVVQVSRWDRLKDPIGVMTGFVDHVLPNAGGHLFLAGPEVAAVSDDPEGLTILEGARHAWAELPSAARDHVHLACLPMTDPEENAVMVNALQRRANVVVQKSLAEGFGLTVAEAMWKARPVVASRVGGIEDQIQDGVSGVLLDDPHDLAHFGEVTYRLLQDEQLAHRIGVAAQDRVRRLFLADRHLSQYVDLFARLVTETSKTATG